MAMFPRHPDVARHPERSEGSPYYATLRRSLATLGMTDYAWDDGLRLG